MLLWPAHCLSLSLSPFAISICICRAIHILFVRLARYAIWISMYPTIWLANNTLLCNCLCLLLSLLLLLNSYSSTRCSSSSPLPLHSRIIVLYATHTHTHTDSNLYGCCSPSTFFLFVRSFFSQFFPIRVNAFFAVVRTATGERDERACTTLGSSLHCCYTKSDMCLPGST